MTQWYFVENRKPVGPFSGEEMQRAISMGRVGGNTWVIKQGESEWVKAEDHRELKEIFSNAVPPMGGELSSVPPVPLESAEAQWVVLVSQKSSDERSSLLQQGPYSVETLRSKIQKGEISYSDYGWHKGMTGWVRLGDREEFSQPHSRAEAFAEPVIDFSHPLDKESKFSELKRESEEFLQNIIQQQRKATEQMISEAMGVQQDRPSEACGDDLLVRGPTLHLVGENTEVLPDVAELIPPTDLHVVVKEPISVTPPDSTSVAQKPERDRGRSKSPIGSVETVESEFKLSQRPLWKIALPVVVSIAVAIVVGGVVLSTDLKNVRNQSHFSDLLRRMQRKSTHLVEPQKILEESKPEVVSVEKNPPKSTKEISPIQDSTEQRQESEAKGPRPQTAPIFKPATYLHLDSYRWKKGRGYLTLRTDASRGQKIRLVLEAATGQVLRYLSFYKVLEVPTSGAIETQVELASLGVPMGNFTIEATLSGFRDRVNTVVYEGEVADFERSLATHRKRISLRQQTEKSDLVVLIKNSEDLMADFSRNLPLRATQVGQWKSFLQSWRRRLVSTDHPNLNPSVLQYRRNFAFAKTWSAFQELRQEILELASTSASDPKTSEVTKRIQNRIRGLKEEIVNLSGWR